MFAIKRACMTACKHASAAARKHAQAAAHKHARTTARKHARFSVVLRELSLHGSHCFRASLSTEINTFIHTRV